jgi:hypothetical protein
MSALKPDKPWSKYAGENVIKYCRFQTTTTLVVGTLKRKERPDSRSSDCDYDYPASVAHDFPNELTLVEKVTLGVEE